MKKCRDCKKFKEISEFHKDRSHKDGRVSYCKPCVKQRRFLYAEKHREEAREKSRTWYAANREKVLVGNQDPIFKARRAEYMKAYRRKNRVKLRERAKSYDRERSKTDVSYKLSLNLRKRLGVAIRDGQKSGSAVRDLGCSIPELKAYLEARFKPGMTWDNWSRNGWHIDHVKPLASFDLTDRAQFLEACHYTNLQPL